MFALFNFTKKLYMYDIDTTLHIIREIETKTNQKQQKTGLWVPSSNCHWSSTKVFCLQASACLSMLRMFGFIEAARAECWRCISCQGETMMQKTVQIIIVKLRAKL